MLQYIHETACFCERNSIRDNSHSAKVCPQSSSNVMKPMPLGFKPGRLDVICTRGKVAQSHYGNLKFRKVIELNLETYSNATTKVEKSLIVTRIVNKVRAESPDGGFVKEEGGRWYKVGDHVAREKVGQGMRDLLHTKYKSSHRSKMRRRREDTSKLDDEVDSFLQTHCKDVTQRLKKISISADSKTDDEVQKLFNEAQTDLLQVLKDKDLKSIFDKYSSKQQVDDEFSTPIDEASLKIEDARSGKRKEQTAEEDTDCDGIALRGNKRRRRIRAVPDDVVSSLLALSNLEPTPLRGLDNKVDPLSPRPLAETTFSTLHPTMSLKLPKATNESLGGMNANNKKRAPCFLASPEPNPVTSTLRKKTTVTPKSLEIEMMKQRISLDFFMSSSNINEVSPLDPLFHTVGKLPIVRNAPAVTTADLDREIINERLARLLCKS